MKKLLYLVILVATCSQAIAQEDPKPATASPSSASKVTEGNQSMNLGVHNAYTVILPNTDDKTVEKMWKDLMKEYDGKTKSVKKADEQLTENVRISAISGSGALSVYSLVKEQGDDVALTAWFDMGSGTFLNSKDYASSSREAESLLQKFSVDVKREMVKRELEEEQKNLKKLEGQLERLVKQKDGLEKDIENYKKRIKEAEDDIVKNIAEQENAQKMIEEQKTVVGDVSKRLDEIH